MGAGRWALGGCDVVVVVRSLNVSDLDGIGIGLVGSWCEKGQTAGSWTQAELKRVKSGQRRLGLTGGGSFIGWDVVHVGAGVQVRFAKPQISRTAGLSQWAGR